MRKLTFYFAAGPLAVGLLALVGAGINACSDARAQGLSSTNFGSPLTIQGAGSQCVYSTIAGPVASVSCPWEVLVSGAGAPLPVPNALSQYVWISPGTGSNGENIWAVGDTGAVAMCSNSSDAGAGQGLNCYSFNANDQTREELEVNGFATQGSVQTQCKFGFFSTTDPISGATTSPYFACAAGNVGASTLEAKGQLYVGRDGGASMFDFNVDNTGDVTANGFITCGGSVTSNNAITAAGAVTAGNGTNDCVSISCAGQECDFNAACSGNAVEDVRMRPKGTGSLIWLMSNGGVYTVPQTLSTCASLGIFEVDTVSKDLCYCDPNQSKWVNLLTGNTGTSTTCPEGSTVTTRDWTWGSGDPFTSLITTPYNIDQTGPILAASTLRDCEETVVQATGTGVETVKVATTSTCTSGVLATINITCNTVGMYDAGVAAGGVAVAANSVLYKCVTGNCSTADVSGNLSCHFTTP